MFYVIYKSSILLFLGLVPLNYTFCHFVTCHLISEIIFDYPFSWHLN